MLRTFRFAQAGACALMVVLSPIAAGHALAQTADAPAGEAVGRPAADGENSGQTTFNNHCRTCHSTDAGDNRLGPSLAGIVGRKAGSVEGFAYSQSFKTSGVTFDEATLDKFIADPASVAPGNNMKPYSGIEDAKVRAEIIGFLKTK